MADLNQLKQKYGPVIDTIQSFSEYGAKLQNVALDGDKIYIKATVPSTVVANRIWDVVKKCDPAYADLHHEIVTTGAAEQPYTVKSGDSLSKISKVFYGDMNKYPQIAKANGVDNPNKIQAGQKLSLPVLN